MKRFLKNFTPDRIVSLVLLLAASGAFAASLVLQLRHDGVGAGTFPLIVSAAFVLFAVLNVIFVIRAMPDRPRGSLSSVMWIALLLIGVASALLLHVPFCIICPVFLFVASFVVLKQSWIASLIAAAATTGFVYLVFALLLRVPLP